MDANGTKFHLLLGRRDWAPGAVAGSGKILGLPGTDLEWDDARHELRLKAEPFLFKAAPRDDAPDQSERRGAGADPNGNWYWIAPDREEIRVRSSGGNSSTHFWSAADVVSACPAASSVFQPVEAQAAPPARTFSGLAVTTDYFLVVGTLAPGGLLVFDLLGGGPPRTICWPEEVPFAPFDMVPRLGGGVWILDRDNGRFWGLDRTFRVLALDGTQTTLAVAQEEIFQSDTGRRPAQPARTFPQAVALTHASPVVAQDPVAIEALPDGAVLILDAPEKQFARILRFAPVPEESGSPAYEQTGATLLDFAAYDFAFAAGQLYVALADGNQAVAFDTAEGLARSNDYYPMRRFGGKALVAANGKAYYDFGERWLPLVDQPHPKFVTQATLETRVFDGYEPQCVWHRLMLDACLPPGTVVTVWSRVADEQADIPFAEWDAEPALLRRGGDSELPFTPTPPTPGRGTFELLLQKARGRFCQLRLQLNGDSRITPRLNALRLYYPRFSYLDRYFPAVYRNDPTSASFLDRFLANFEGLNTAFEDRIAAAQMLFDVRSVPADALAWLAGWFGVVLDPAWDEARRRLFLTHAMQFFQWRGTVYGLKMALRLAFEEQADPHIFDAPGAACRCGDRFRIVEKFLTRQTPSVELGDPTEIPSGPQFTTTDGPWNPAQGADALNARYHAATKDIAPFSLIPLADADAEAARVAFAKSVLGFVPSDPTEEIAAWRQAQLLGLPAATPGPIPDDQPLPTGGSLAKLWRAYQTSSASEPYGQQRQMWQRFLVRRYLSMLLLNQAHHTHWESFEAVAYPTALPSNAARLQDWVEFEAHVLPTRAAAHRFSVLLPVKRTTATMADDLARQLALANRIVELEKPAHTVFDVKFFWALFRVGEARLGSDSVLGLGGRDPALFPAPAVLGQSYLADSLVAVGPPPSLPGRLVSGRDRLRRNPNHP